MSQTYYADITVFWDSDAGVYRGVKDGETVEADSPSDALRKLADLVEENQSNG